MRGACDTELSGANSLVFASEALTARCFKAFKELCIASLLFCTCVRGLQDKHRAEKAALADAELHAGC